MSSIVEMRYKHSQIYSSKIAGTQHAIKGSNECLKKECYKIYEKYVNVGNTAFV